ncbi:MAG: hypothetical protein HRU34_23085 [Richelia sp.]|nr:hypothetical protein [Richelia sp.]
MIASKIKYIFGVAESGDDFTKISRISQWFQSLIDPLIQQRHIFILLILPNNQGKRI